MDSIIWQKKTTMNITGGAEVTGLYTYSPNGIIKIDYEFILISKIPGSVKLKTKEIKNESILTKEDWKQYFTGQ